MPTPPRVLFAAAEAQPLVKTGGLGDVCGSLPGALRRAGVDARLILPAYPAAIAGLPDLRTVAALRVAGHHGPVTIRLGRLGGVPVYLVDAPEAFDRPGGPYADFSGRDWADNARRFATFARAVVRVALGRADVAWRADVVHAHDWHTGLVPALLAREPRRPATVFTIHNLAYQGLFEQGALGELGLPRDLWSLDGLEFHGRLSFMKGGLAFADRVTAVSPTYAVEICTPQAGCGLDGLLRHRRERLAGILNGIDVDAWDPARDPALVRPFDARALEGKAENKRALQRALGLVEDARAPLLAFVGRLVEQKGVDLLLGSLPALLRSQAQVVVHGTGDARLADALRAAQAAAPGRVAAVVGYSEDLAHQVLAGADVCLMPSRFEPCGLVQLYALRYGAVPVVRRTGGLADTVVDPDDAGARRATGFSFREATPDGLLEAVSRALRARATSGWTDLVAEGMRQDHSWARSAREYSRLYGLALGRPAPRTVRAPRAPQAWSRSLRRQVALASA
ncbi:MAG: glycogen synthase GlgA [Planctomycetes bacterium]|nr:glycogen synthase GlgA [Planctomycetota bacterium]